MVSHAIQALGNGKAWAFDYIRSEYTNEQSKPIHLYASLFSNYLEYGYIQVDVRRKKSTTAFVLDKNR